LSHVPEVFESEGKSHTSLPWTQGTGDISQIQRRQADNRTETNKTSQSGQREELLQQIAVKHRHTIH